MIRELTWRDTCRRASGVAPESDDPEGVALPVQDRGAQCRASVGGDPSVPIATMIRSPVSAPSTSPLLSIWTILSRLGSRGVPVLLDQQVRGARDVEIGWGHALLDYLVGAHRGRGRSGSKTRRRPEPLVN
jgi:hypothetical protein